MNYNAAKILLHAGGKIRLTTWPRGQYMTMADGLLIDQTGSLFLPLLEDITRKDWIEISDEELRLWAQSDSAQPTNIQPLTALPINEGDTMQFNVNETPAIKIEAKINGAPAEVNKIVSVKSNNEAAALAVISGDGKTAMVAPQAPGAGITFDVSAFVKKPDGNLCLLQATTAPIDLIADDIARDPVTNAPIPDPTTGAPQPKELLTAEVTSA